MIKMGGNIFQLKEPQKKEDMHMVIIVQKILVRYKKC